MNDVRKSYTEMLKLRPRTVESLLIPIALLLGFAQAWSSRYQVGVDIISYMDMGDAYMRGDWAMAINSLWPPLYALLLGLGRLVLRPTPFWEYPVVQLVNYLIFVFTLLAFRFFLKEFKAYRACKVTHDLAPVPPLVNDLQVSIIGFSLFIWSSISLIKVSQTNPDMLMAGIILIVSGFLLRASRLGLTVLGALLLGASLGAGYLAKPIMFPMSLVFLGVLYGILRKAKPSRVTMAFMAFCAVAGPFVTTLSLAKGRFTFSDQGLFNYTWYVVDAPHYTVHWQGEDPAQGHPKHPTRMLSKKPAAYEFATPIKGTYPVWYDPTYWCDGTKYHFILKQQFRAIHRNCAKIASVFLGGLNGAIISSAFLLFWTCARKFIAACDIWKHWFLLVPSILAIAVYALIAVEPRYLGMFTALIGIVLLTGTDNYNRTLTSGVAILLSVSCLIATYEESSKVFFDALRGKWHRSNVSWDIADRLRELGLREGDNIASVNYSAADIARWARLAKVRIIAEVPHLRGEVGDGFWDAAPEKRTEIIHLFAKTGAVLVVSNEKPNGPDGSGWIQVGGFDSAEGESQDRATYALPLLNLLDRTAQGSPR